MRLGVWWRYIVLAGAGSGGSCVLVLDLLRFGYSTLSELVSAFVNSPPRRIGEIR